MRLLIVEDDAELAAALARGLRDEGFDVDSCGDGEDGLHTALGGAYDLVILDVMLPGRDGCGVFRCLRQSDCQVPVLFVTARHEVAHRIRGLQAGGVYFLPKPFGFEELLTQVRAAVGGSGG